MYYSMTSVKIKILQVHIKTLFKGVKHIQATLCSTAVQTLTENVLSKGVVQI